MNINRGITGSGVSWGTEWTWAGGPYNVKSYATAGKLVNPKRLISSISSLPSTFTWTNTVSSGTVANVAYDLFTSSNINAETWAGDYELMIWVGIYGGAGPISSTGSPIATVTIAGHSWKLYYGLNGTMKVYSFVYANGNLQNFSGDVKAFYTYLTNSQSFPASSQYLLGKSDFFQHILLFLFLGSSLARRPENLRERSEMNRLWKKWGRQKRFNPPWQNE